MVTFVSEQFWFLVIKSLDPDPDWYFSLNAGSGSGINESGFVTVVVNSFLFKFTFTDVVSYSRGKSSVNLFLIYNPKSGTITIFHLLLIRHSECSNKDPDFDFDIFNLILIKLFYVQSLNFFYLKLQHYPVTWNNLCFRFRSPAALWEPGSLAPTSPCGGAATCHSACSCWPLLCWLPGSC